MRKPFLLILIFLFTLNIIAQKNNIKDQFGITQFYPTKEGTIEWNSAHWNNGIRRNIKYTKDNYDPTNYTEDHSGSTTGFEIDGMGIMKMAGGSPRFHINSLDSSKVKKQFYLNTEFTAYYRRIGNNGADYGGMVVGVRSGPLAHATNGGNDCDATTYYARFRHDGDWDFEKELKHPASGTLKPDGLNDTIKLWNGNKMPENKWIGMKYIVYNIDKNTKVKLELYIDTLSNGNPLNGGVWIKVGETIDKGYWPSQISTISGCAYTDPNTIITQGNGTCILRTDGDAAEYKMVSLREIIISNQYKK